MNRVPYVLPEPLGRLISLLPAYPGSLLFVAAVNRALADRLPLNAQRALSGKKLRIRINDARVSFDFQWIPTRFAACRFAGDFDLTISANAYDFLILAQQREDPDTLFFGRRMIMEGDTELGLLVKNTMDAAGPILPDWKQIAPANALARMISVLKEK